MISTKQLTTKINTLLNEAASTEPFEFRIKAGTSKAHFYDRSGNTVTEYINGLLTTISGETTNTNTGIQLISETCLLQVIFAIPNNDSNGGVTQLSEDGTIDSTSQPTQAFDGAEEKIDKIREIINSVFVKNAQYTMTDDKNVSYIVSMVYQPATDGQRAIVQKLGLSYTLRAYVNFTIVEDGINTRQSSFSIDGVIIPFDSFTVTHAQTLDAYVPHTSSTGTAETIASQRSINFNFELPALGVNSVTNIILSDMLAGDLNTAHILGVYMPNSAATNAIKYFLVTISEDTASGAGMGNIGLHVSFVPIIQEYDFVSDPSTLYVRDFSNSGNNHQLTVYIPDGTVYYSFHSKSATATDKADVPCHVSVGLTDVGYSDSIYYSTKEILDELPAGDGGEGVR